MTKLFTGFFGGLGGIGTTFSFVPQVYKVFRSNTGDTISPYMLLIHSVGVSSWIVYGVLKKDYYVITFNSMSLLMVQSMLLKIVWDKTWVRRQKPDRPDISAVTDLWI